MLKIKIGNKYIGDYLPVFIIAEAGVNHNGSIKLALKLIDAAVAAGADAIKFQTFRAEDVATNSVKMAEYQKRNTDQAESQLEMLRKLELPDNFYKPLIKHCYDKKIIFLSSPHGGFNSIDLLQRLKIPAFKFGSGDLTNFPVLEYVAKFGKPMILGTGMATLDEVRDAIGVIKKVGNNKIIVLHCTTNYPCPPDEVNLRAMSTMKNKLSVLVGYSDHTDGIQVPVMASTLGACVIEKHLTLDKNMVGPDHKASLEPDELKKMVHAVRQVNVILGSYVKKPTKSEIKSIKVTRKSLVSLNVIKKGKKFTAKNVGIKRPGTGLPPGYYYQLIGKKAKRNIKSEILISKKDYDK
jgi:N-acetylneuraminate synthase